MTATVKKLEPTRVELEIAIPDEEMEKARERAFKALVRNTRIPGFRPGKAPRRIFEANYGTAAIEERALDEVVPKVYTQALDEHALFPLERPQFELLPRESSDPIRFKAVVDVRPEITLVDLSTITIEEPAPKATDEELDRALEGLRREGATLVPVERPAQVGDTLVADYVGKIDGEPFAGGTAEQQHVDLIEERFIPGFVSGIAGMTVGEERDVEAVFPEDYAEPSLAGKTALFHVKIHEIKEPELPELDDNFAARYMPHEPTLEALKNELRRRVEETMRSQFKNEHADEYVDRLLAAHDFPLPSLLIDRELEGAIQQKQLEAAQSGKSWADFLKDEEKDEETLRAELRPEAEKRVKTLLLIEEVARLEKIQATNAEIEREIMDLANRYGQPPQRIREAIGDQLHGLVDGIIRSKTLDLMLERAITPTT